MTIDAVYAALEDLRARRPLVHNITNYVAMTVSANVLLALGASPAMVHAVEEVEDFVAISDALAVNIGTLSPPWVAAMRAAVARARALGKPWVLDPVGCGATAYRTQVAAELAALKPSVIRGNASEILSLAGQVGRAAKASIRQPPPKTRPRGAALAQRSRLRRRRHRRHRLCQRRATAGRRPCRPCADAAVDRARLFAQRRDRRLYRGAPAARGRGRGACRVRRRRRRCGATLPRSRPSAGGNLRRPAPDGPRDASGPRAAFCVSETRAPHANLLHPRAAADPQIAEAEKILRACVHCGFCTATCPTYVLLGDELDSPRGRIYLIKEMLENDRPATRDVVKHIDRCLSCLACMTTCPSGVHYMHLVDHAREHIEKTYKRPLADRAMRGLLARVLPDPALFRLGVVAGLIAKPFARALQRARLEADGGHAAAYPAP